jgi:hypothetical protein
MKEREGDSDDFLKFCIIFVVNQHGFKICSASYPMRCLDIVPFTTWNMLGDKIQNGVIF